MNKISDQIKSGAIAFLKTEYTYLAAYVVVVFAALVLLYSIDPPSDDHTDGIRYGACFLAGALLSGSAGWGGMLVATDANVRTTQAADVEGLAVALRVAFTGGAVMGFTVVGLGLMGVSIMFYLVTLGYDDSSLEQRLIFASDSLAGFGFGASSIALFARVAGGIFTKAADVGADLVGKVEMDIPEGTSGLTAMLCLRLSRSSVIVDAYLPVSDARRISRCVQRATAHQLHDSLASLLTLFALFLVLSLAYPDTLS
jgi:K(+)-stimulated pyrophosphate-energized sodium pump